MAESWSNELRTAIRAKTPDFRGLGEIRLLSHENGPQRGQRLLLCRTADGFEAEINVDRAMDIAALRYHGINLGWNGPTRSAGGHGDSDERGLALLRSFDGLLVTCGLDHHGVPADGTADHFIYPHRKRVYYPLHGRVSGLAATLAGYGLESEGEVPVLWAEGVIRQAALFGEVLELRRRIEMPLLGATLRIRDVVSNVGYRPTRHRILYHFNLGYPLLDAGTCIEGVDKDFAKNFCIEAPLPHPDHVERVDVVPVLATNGRASVRVVNPLLGGLALTLAYDTGALPAFAVWRAYQSGIFALGLEPHSGDDGQSRSACPGDTDVLGPGEKRYYSVSLEASLDDRH